MTTRAPSEPTLTLDVAILGRGFKVACKESERAELLEAVALLDGRMREIRDSGKIGGAERIAVMAALNIANELLRERKVPRSSSADGVDVGGIERRIRDMSAAIENTLAGQDKLF
jgi:cell division protein ZapA